MKWMLNFVILKIWFLILIKNIEELKKLLNKLLIKIQIIFQKLKFY